MKPKIKPTNSRYILLATSHRPLVAVCATAQQLAQFKDGKTYEFLNGLSRLVLEKEVR